MGSGKRVLLCFTCDPYGPGDTSVTREAIQILHRYGLGVEILTKGGMRAARDFDILLTNMDAFASTLTFYVDRDSLEWEPGAAMFEDRFRAIRLAHLRGIPTWVSLEPVIDPHQALMIITETHEYVDLYKVGCLNYYPLVAEAIDWPKFGWEVVAVLESLGTCYYLKRDLCERAGIEWKPPDV
jgi:hypothetical protein